MYASPLAHDYIRFSLELYRMESPSLSFLLAFSSMGLNEEMGLRVALKMVNFRALQTYSAN